MRIESISLQFPSRCITNDDLVDQIRAANSDQNGPVVEKYCRTVRLLLRKAGSGTRFYRDLEADETAISIIKRAVTEALHIANLQPGDIDLLIYCGVGRGFAEPSTAAFVAHALQMTCEGFDVLDACMSWIRALQIAEAMLAAKAYSRILIVNGEFNIYECGFPAILQFAGFDRLAYAFPAFTIGEAAAATVLVDSPQKWRFSFRSRPEFAPLCSVPLPGYAQFCAPDDRIGIAGNHRLSAFGKELAEVGIHEMVNLLNESIQDLAAVKWYVPHVPGYSVCEYSAGLLNIGDRVVSDTFSEFGNLVSASLPAALWKLQAKSLLSRGDNIVLCPVSAGMSFCVAEFVY